MTVGNEIAYYFRPVNGSDSNDGKSFGGAWKTWQKVITELCGATGSTTDNAILFLVNEGGAYTGPYHSGMGESTGIDYPFTTYDAFSSNFTICGLSADGSYDPNTNFEFDLSGFTGTAWLNAFSGSISDKGIQFKNITWKNATTATDYIITTEHEDMISQSAFYNCIFEDNNVNYGLIYQGGYGEIFLFSHCIFRRNNSYLAGNALFRSYYGINTPGRNCIGQFEYCIFEENQTDASSSKYIILTSPIYGPFKCKNSVFYNNGYDSDDVCIWLGTRDEQPKDIIDSNIFFNNTGTAVHCQDAYYSDTTYGNSEINRKITNNIYVLNNKSMYFEVEPGLRFTDYTNNVFYNNTVEDIPDLIETLPGISGGNHVFDPEFTNGYSGDFSVPHDSRLFSYSTVPGVPIGGSFVQKKSFTTTTSGSLSFGSGEVGDTVTVSGKSYQKVNASPPVWRRFVTTPPLTGIFEPTDITGLFGWYDASDYSTITESSNIVSLWNDKSGRGNHLSSSGTNQPTYTTTGLNSLPSIDFDGSSDKMSLGGLSIGNTGDVSGFVVMNADVLDGDLFHIYDNTLSRGYRFRIIDSTTIEVLYFNSGGAVQESASSVSLSTSTPYILAQVVTDSTNFYAHYVNGTLVGNGSLTTDPSALNFNSLIIGDDSSGGDNFNGDISEIILYDNKISDSDVRKVEGYLAHKWGLAGNLPSSHPFKNYAP